LANPAFYAFLRVERGALVVETHTVREKNFNRQDDAPRDTPRRENRALRGLALERLFTRSTDGAVARDSD
jgi:hypothetical protein